MQIIIIDLHHIYVQKCPRDEKTKTLTVFWAMRLGAQAVHGEHIWYIHYNTSSS